MDEWTKTVWQSGDVVTAAKLNKIENQLEYVTENGGGGSGKREKVIMYQGTIPITRSENDDASTVYPHAVEIPLSLSPHDKTLTVNLNLNMLINTVFTDSILVKCGGYLKKYDFCSMHLFGNTDTEIDYGFIYSAPNSFLDMAIVYTFDEPEEPEEDAQEIVLDAKKSQLYFSMKGSTIVYNGSEPIQLWSADDITELPVTVWWFSGSSKEIYNSVEL